ncbi:hypothetical protein [Listeria seeligeri]|uniref:hypothetical protein n=1 Tax=Listeria seeligeri TaxID=1640 RepID=UPI0022EBBF6D|nr:hypothetical protein [Listeria seeligeri]
MKVVLLNKVRCENDIDSQWDVANMENLLERLAQITSDEFAEGETFRLFYNAKGDEKRPAGAFRVIKIYFYVIKLEYLGLEFV